ncbi:MAG TPA: SDR family NAD(P)-dependent oxidoreductase [Burkholderiales bacterium]|nr:SDR family NAD(P)-dependent oxidoreductase [Burkholderiales bacterium]
MPKSSFPVAVITGAARGIGFACAVELAKKGFAVVLTDLPSVQLTHATEQICAMSVQALDLPGDVSDFAGARVSASRVVERWGRIDVLINNAGMSQPKTLLEISEAEWDRTLAVNLKGCFNWCKAVVPTMLEGGGGRIVNVSSVSANTGGAASAVSKFAYCASKAGILGMTRGLAKELAPKITVNAVCPGSIETDMTAHLIAQRRSLIEQSIPMGRLGTPEDVAVVVAFLATVQPNYITGEVIDVDGGQWVN